MTDAQWRRTTNAAEMLAWLGDRPGERSLRLFACACLRQVEASLAFEALECIKYMEKHADRLLRWDEAAARIRGRIPPRDTFADRPTFAEWLPVPLLDRSPPTAAANSLYWSALFREYGPRWANWPTFNWENQDPNSRWEPADTTAFAAPLRDIVGDPFRPVAWDRRWQTSTAVALARRMYESRDYDPMPILADALQDAGCEEKAILNHCLHAGPHVRGCWVVDRVLGKA